MENTSPKIEILGDLTVISYPDGRTSTVQGMQLREVIRAENARVNETNHDFHGKTQGALASALDRLTHSAALVLAAASGLRAVWGLRRTLPHPIRWTRRTFRFLSDKSRSIAQTRNPRRHLVGSHGQIAPNEPGKK